MKKLVTFVTALLFFSLTACSSGNSDDTEKEALKSQIESLQSQINETESTSDTEPISEAPVQEDSTEAIEDGDWEIRYYVDKFDNTTKERYITTKKYIKGKFSNSATDNSDLNVLFVVDHNKITISLFEYGDKLVKNSNSYSKKDSKYLVYFSEQASDEKLIIGTMAVGDDRITIDNHCDGDYFIDGQLSWIDGMERILNALKNYNGGTIKFYIIEEERPTTHYSFSVDVSNFRDLYYNF